MATNEKQIDRLKQLAEARLSRGALGGPAPGGRGAATAPPSGSGLVSRADRWKDGTPKRKIDRLLGEIDRERFHATGDEADPAYQELVKDKMSELLRLEWEESRKKGPADAVTVSEADAAALLYDAQVSELDAAIAAFEAKKAALQQPTPKEETKHE